MNYENFQIFFQKFFANISIIMLFLIFFQTIKLNFFISKKKLLLLFFFNQQLPKILQVKVELVIIGPKVITQKEQN